MKALLAKIALRKAVGLYVGEHEIVVSEVARTPLGSVELTTHVEPYSTNELSDAIQRALRFVQGAKPRRLSVAIGLPNSRVFFGTRPVRPGDDPSPEAMMQRLLASPNLSVNDLAIDLLRGTINKQPVASVAACRKKHLATILAVLEKCGCLTLRTEPVPCALARMATLKFRSPRRSKNILRVFLGATEGLGVLVVAGLPVAWKTFPLPAGSEGMNLLSAVRTLTSQSTYHSMETALDFAMIHGRTDLQAQLEKEGVPTELGTRVRWHEGPGLCSGSAALGLALGGINPDATAFDLSRAMKPRPSLRDIFPWGELACQCAAMILMAIFFAYRSAMLSDACAAVQAECSQNKILASSTVPQLTDEIKDLTKKIEAIHGFVSTRIPWTSCTRDIAASLPAGVHLIQFTGTNPLVTDKSRKSGKTRSFTIGAASPVKDDGVIPPEVGNLLVLLRHHAQLNREFPLIQLSGIKQGQMRAGKDAVAMASFTIVGQLDSAKGAKAGGDAKGKKVAK